MKKNNIQDIEEVLSSIKRVEANPFLLTRIQEKLKKDEQVNRPLVWALGFSFLLILAVNLVGLTSSSSQNQERSSYGVEELNYLLPEKGFYD